MSGTRYAKAAAAMLARAAEREVPAPSPESRERAIAALEQVIRARAR